jgi:hypothetical protein
MAAFRVTGTSVARYLFGSRPVRPPFPARVVLLQVPARKTLLVHVLAARNSLAQPYHHQFGAAFREGRVPWTVSHFRAAFEAGTDGTARTLLENCALRP